MSEFSESFFESEFKEWLLIIDFCVISSEAGFSRGGCSDFNNIVLCAIMVSIMPCLFLSSSHMLFSLSRKTVLGFNISVFIIS